MCMDNLRADISDCRQEPNDSDPMVRIWEGMLPMRHRNLSYPVVRRRVFNTVVKTENLHLMAECNLCRGEAIGVNCVTLNYVDDSHRIPSEASPAEFHHSPD